MQKSLKQIEMEQLWMQFELTYANIQSICLLFVSQRSVVAKVHIKVKWYKGYNSYKRSPYDFWLHANA